MSSAIKYSFVGILITAVVAIILWKPGGNAAPPVEGAPGEGSASLVKDPDPPRRSGADLVLAASQGHRSGEAPAPPVDAGRADRGTGDGRPLQLVARGGAEGDGGRAAEPVAPQDPAPRRTAGPAAGGPGASRAAEREGPAVAAGQTIHVVASGESLYTIARKHYGSGRDWRRIVEANPEIDPDRLRVGTKLAIPGATSSAPKSAPASGPEPSPPASGPGRVHVVQKGESLYKLAAKYYGNGNEWRRIREANSQVEDWEIRPGMELVIPTR